MINTIKNYVKRHILPATIQDKNVVEAYDIWAENYDSQPGNLMLDLDKLLFTKLLNDVELENKTVADIGCGTGRHWAKIFAYNPAGLSGFDVSPGMLNKLNEKFPSAQTHTITDNHFSSISDHSFDVILSTLTVAHIEDIKEALQAWCRIAAKSADVIITDFHPDALAFGGKRTFKHQNKQIAVQNFVHTTTVIKNVFLNNGFYMVAEDEIRVDESLKHYYEKQNALHVYEKFKGFPIIYGLHFRRA